MRGRWVRAFRSATTAGWLQDPAWSPDGTQVSYTRFQFAPPSGGAGGTPWPIGEVFALRLDAPGAAPRPLVRREAPHEALISAAWAPDGRTLYAVRRRPLDPTAVQVDLVRFDLDTGAPAVLSTPFEAIGGGHPEVRAGARQRRRLRDMRPAFRAPADSAGSHPRWRRPLARGRRQPPYSARRAACRG